MPFNPQQDRIRAGPSECGTPFGMICCPRKKRANGAGMVM
jgi:hypothetical protein